MSFDKQVNTKQIEYLNLLPNIGWYPEEISDYIFKTTKEAAVAYMNAGYNGSYDDGGASRMIYGLKEFIRGYNCGY
jgi:hypothetical protein